MVETALATNCFRWDLAQEHQIHVLRIRTQPVLERGGSKTTHTTLACPRLTPALCAVTVESPKHSRRSRRFLIGAGFSGWTASATAGILRGTILEQSPHHHQIACPPHGGAALGLQKRQIDRPEVASVPPQDMAPPDTKLGTAHVESEIQRNSIPPP